jgi:hypothetical protein
LVDGIASEGELFAALLSWSEQAFQADEEWHDLATADQLALIWTHADRLTALLVDHGVNIEQAIKFFAEHQPNRSVGRLFQRNVDLDRDCAAPDHLYALGLVYHAFAYVFGADQTRDGVPPVSREKLGAIAIVKDGEGFRPHPALLARSDLSSNSMGSFLADRPTRLFEPGMDPAPVREQEIDAAFAALEAEPNDSRPWLWLRVAGGAALTTSQAARLDAVFEKTDLGAFSQSDDGLKACWVVNEVWRRLGDNGSEEVLIPKLRALAAKCAATYPRALKRGDGSKAAEAFSGLLETIAAGARTETTAASLDLFSRLALLVSDAWPAAARHPRSAGTRRAGRIVLASVCEPANVALTFSTSPQLCLETQPPSRCLRQDR